MSDAKEEIKINDKTIGMNTEIRINIKTLLILIGIILPSITGLYYNLNSNISSIQTGTEKEISHIKEEVGNIKDQMLVIGINVENSNKAQENMQKSMDRLINKLIPESRPNNYIPVTSTNPENIEIE